MAVYDDKDFAASPDRTAAIDLSRLLNLAGAVLSVTLVAGLGFWGYRLAVRDVRGIPVIRALEGPARVAPADPGGDITRHQGLAVNAVAAEGTAEPPPDSLVLAPRPADLASDDPPMGELPAAAAIDAATRDVAGPEPDAMAAAMTEASRRLPADGVALSGGGAIPASVPGVAVSPVPRPRPGSEGAAAVAAADPGPSAAPAAIPAIEEQTPVDAVVVEGEDPVAEAAAAAVAAALAPQQLDLDPAALAPGTRVVQLGTFDTPDEARAGWDAIARQFAPLLDGKRRVVERTETGGERFYRLRAAGFTDVDDARRFCAVLEDAGTGCVPAIVR
ncbi:MAG: SPOR domain-containing protein [Rhodobacteraceae bacterium]|nr:SPOR domain-containing protein [Paracoccaceae bacterium]